jgi:hypothetical protein
LIEALKASAPLLIPSQRNLPTAFSPSGPSLTPYGNHPILFYQHRFVANAIVSSESRSAGPAPPLEREFQTVMKEDQHQFLRLPKHQIHRPACVGIEEAAKMFGWKDKIVSALPPTHSFPPTEIARLQRVGL